MYVRLFAILFVLSTCIPDVIGNTVVSNSVSNAAGSVTYSISYSGTSGSLTHAPKESITTNDNLISVAITGCSIQGADKIDGQLTAKDAVGDEADVGAYINGPEASVTNYDLFGYVTSDLAWAGQYADSIRISGKGPYMALGAYSFSDPNYQTYAQANSGIGFTGLTNTVYTESVNSWWQDSMAGGTYPNKWAMSNIYKSSTAAVDLNGLLMDIATSSSYGSTRDISSDFKPILSGKINSQSMGYADPRISYTNLDVTTGGPFTGGFYNGFTYYYINVDKGIDKHDVIYY